MPSASFATVSARVERDLRDESLALLTNILSDGQAASVVEGRVRSRDRRLHAAEPANGRGRRRHVPVPARLVRHYMALPIDLSNLENYIEIH